MICLNVNLNNYLVDAPELESVEEWDEHMCGDGHRDEVGQSVHPERSTKQINLHRNRQHRDGGQEAGEDREGDRKELHIPAPHQVLVRCLLSPSPTAMIQSYRRRHHQHQRQH